MHRVYIQQTINSSKINFTNTDAIYQEHFLCHILKFADFLSTVHCTLVNIFIVIFLQQNVSK